MAQKLDVETPPAACRAPARKQAAEEWKMWTQEERERQEAKLKWRLDINALLAQARAIGGKSGRKMVISTIQFFERWLGRQPSPDEQLSSRSFDELHELALAILAEFLQDRGKSAVGSTDDAENKVAQPSANDTLATGSMRTCEEILSAIALLPPPEFAKLRSALERLDRRANAIVLVTKRQITFRLCRQTDAERWDSRQPSLRIEDDYSFNFRLHQWRQGGDALNFAQVYLTLKHLAGESSESLDDFKMAFLFPFAMDVIKGNQTFAYLLDAYNIRDSLYFTLHKVVDADDKRLQDGRLHPPFEDEFSKEEIRYFRDYFYGYLSGYWETLKPEQFQPFVRCVPAALLIFGYLDGKAFEEQFESCDEYEPAWQRLKTRVAQERKSTKADSFAVRDVHSPEERG